MTLLLLYFQLLWCAHFYFSCVCAIHCSEFTNPELWLQRDNDECRQFVLPAAQTLLNEVKGTVDVLHPM